MTRPGPKVQTPYLHTHEQLDLAETVRELATMSDAAFVSCWPAIVLDVLAADGVTTSTSSCCNYPSGDLGVRHRSNPRQHSPSKTTILVPYGEVARLIGVVAKRTRNIIREDTP